MRRYQGPDGKRGYHEDCSDPAERYPVTGKDDGAGIPGYPDLRSPESPGLRPAGSVTGQLTGDRRHEAGRQNGTHCHGKARNPGRGSESGREPWLNQEKNRIQGSIA